MIEDQYEPLPPNLQPTFPPSTVFHWVFDYSEPADLFQIDTAVRKMGQIGDPQLLLMLYRFVIQRERHTDGSMSVSRSSIRLSSR